ncbi:MAG: aminotransferase, partial [Gammaproteobacteria bacterium]|nr:aminotransferase [Gammaproteobacteria bacterium]
MAKRSNSAFQRDIEGVVHPYTNLAKHLQTGPMMLERGAGIYVWDDQGKQYIEGLSGLWCTALGYGNEELVQVAAEQMRRLPYSHLFASKGHEPAADLAEKLKEMVPFEASKVFFTNSGSEANDTQVKLLWYYNNAVGRPHKKKIISRLKGYHGVTLAAASLTGLPVLHESFDLPIAGVLHTDCPHYYRFAESGESEAEFVERLVENLRDLLEREGSETVAAFIAEPVMGAGGVIVPPAGYFEAIQAVLAEHDIVFIVDEVICGFGRTGNMFGSETFNIRPGTMSVAKALSSAYLPIGAVLLPEDMYAPIAEESNRRGVFGHGYTYTGHPVCAAVAKRTLEIYERDAIVAHVQQVTPQFQKRLRDFGEHPLVGEARGVGLLGACEIVKDKTTKQPFDATAGVGARCALLAQEHGLIVRALGDTVAFCPPLIISADEIDELF